MRPGQLKVIKFGGSVITIKDVPRSLRVEVLLRLLKELSEYLKEEGLRSQVVLIHGGGSYGHPLVKDCVSRHGKIVNKCYVEVSDAMDSLSSTVRGYAIAIGIPAVSVPPRAMCIILSSRPQCYLEAVASLLSRGLVPILYGDVVASDQGFEVLSGDTLAWYVAKELGASEILFVTDVDGLYDADPKVNPKAKRITVARVDDVLGYAMNSSSRADVTGGMRKKLLEGKVIGVTGVKVKIVGGFIEGNVYSALRSDNFVGSIVWY